MFNTEKLGKELLFFDGAMGSLLQKRGLAAGAQPEPWCIEKADEIKEIHLEYLKAGADILTTNTFGGNRYKMEPLGYKAGEIAAAGIRCAKAAIKEFGGDREKYAALDIGPTGKLLKPNGDTSFEEAYEVFSEIAIAGEKAGADLILLETFTDTYELKAAVLAAKENTSLPVFATCSFDDKGKLLTGADPLAAIALLEGLGVDALGINCSMGPDEMRGVFLQYAKYASLPIIINPNAGLPVLVDGNTVYNVLPEDFAESCRFFAENGAAVMGGCCGTTPEHIQKLTALCGKITPKPLTDKGITVVSSYAKAQIIGEKPIIIGERINPTGKKLFKQALIDSDMGYILSEGLTQTEKGSHVLDVNVGLPGIDEKEMMAKAIETLQSSIALPLQIDSADPQVLEKAMRLYNGKPMVNSVNGKEEIMEAVFPLVKKYGGVLVALTLDDKGIPNTPEERFKIAEKIVLTAEKYGINRKNIVVDALTMTVSSSADAAKITLEALKMIKERLGVSTILGVSNVSFGLPGREVINSAFFTLALGAGLDCCIINPKSDAMMNAYRSWCALNGFDENCADYIAALTGSENKPKEEKKTSLYELILGGVEDKAYEAAKEELKTKAPEDVIKDFLAPALDEAGKRFDTLRIFLPQLMACARAAEKAFDAISEYYKEKGGERKKNGKIVIATVKGDNHDIGKNIVRVMLDNYGFEVIDLGKNVPPETIADYVSENKIELAGLSALMTTTVPYMEETIKLLNEKCPWCKVMVGGAVLTEEYAQSIGADFYGKDAMASVEYAKKVFKTE